MSRSRPDRIVVVVPAHDEERLIGSALRALRKAAAEVAPHVETTLVVVANGCRDDTAALASAAGAVVIETPTANVGAARGAGFSWAMQHAAGRLDRLWLSTTDADSAVAPRWLAAQLDAAAAGADVYLGTVTLPTAEQRTFATWATAYDEAIVAPHRHGHVHGASMGMRAESYRHAGGFSALSAGEDADLVERLIADGAHIVWDATCAVVTSARLAARAPRGVSRDLEQSLRVRDEAV